jgi:hypothetical protein
VSAPVRVLRHSKWDALLVALSFVQGGVLLTAPSIPLIALGLWWNANTISHNFIHLPFFRSANLNRIYSLYLSLLLGFPQSLWRGRHLAHHSGHPFKLRWTTDLVSEAGPILLMWAVLAAKYPRFFLLVYLPGYVTGLALCYIHGYFEHAQGTKSNYGLFYNTSFFNDGYHVEHHSRPSEHWTRVPRHVVEGANTSRWPAILRWMEIADLVALEALVVRSTVLQKFLLQTHERALKRILKKLPAVRTIEIVGGGMFPRSALLLRKLIPEARITIIDSSAENIQMAKAFLKGPVELRHKFFDLTHRSEADLLVIPLCFVGERAALYKDPPAKTVLIHDWIWRKRNDSTVVSPWLLKRLNLIRR